MNLAQCVEVAGEKQVGECDGNEFNLSYLKECEKNKQVKREKQEKKEKHRAISIYSE